MMLAVTRRLPAVRGSGRLANMLKRFYLRKPRKTVDTKVLGFRMKLEPSECIDGGLLFYPHLYDRREVAYLRAHLRRGDVFIDAGANVGFYSLIASDLVGRNGRVLAIEADPYNYEKLVINLQLNDARNVCAVNVGVSDRRENRRLGINTSGNRGGNSFLLGRPAGVNVKCFPLTDLVKGHEMGTIHGAKFDIEGYEFRVLSQFFEEADPSLYPRFMIIEQNPEWARLAGGYVIELVRRKGYAVRWSSELNYIAELN